MNWLVLRVLNGLPLKIAEAICEMGVPAYCPAEVRKRRHPHFSRLTITQRKPLFPGYLFAAANEDWNTTPISLSPAFPLDSINSTRVRARWLMVDNRLVFMTDIQLAAVKELERAWRPEVDDIVHALKQIAKGARPPRGRFVNISEFRALALAS